MWVSQFSHQFSQFSSYEMWVSQFSVQFSVISVLRQFSLQHSVIRVPAASITRSGAGTT